MKNYTVNEVLKIAEYDEESWVYFVEADGEDITITVSEWDGDYNYGMRGDKDGSITLDGPGNGSVYRKGHGNGHAWRFGTGNGSAYRTGAGDGSAFRTGVGEGSAYRFDSGDGTAFRDNLGSGYAVREGGDIKSEEAKMEKVTEENSDERAAYLTTCELWLTENTPLREELAYRDGHKAGWNNAIKQMGKLIDGKVLS